MKFYHGTSAEAAEKILVDGFGCNSAAMRKRSGIVQTMAVHIFGRMQWTV